MFQFQNGVPAEKNSGKICNINNFNNDKISTIEIEITPAEIKVCL